jgi:hypothetical protein
MNEKLIELAKQIFKQACENAINNNIYIRYVEGWRENSNFIIYDIARIIQEAFLYGETHETMNLKVWKSLGESAVYVKIYGSKQIYKIVFDELMKLEAI